MKIFKTRRRKALEKVRPVEMVWAAIIKSPVACLLCDRDAMPRGRYCYECNRRQDETIRWGEPAPTDGEGPSLWALVIEDMKSRDKFGREKYGKALQAKNGRNMLKDAYEEVLDLAVYLRGCLEEQKCSE